MEIRFDRMVFSTKDLVLIIGFLVSGFSFYLKMETRFSNMEKQMQQIINANELEKVKIYSKIDNLKTAHNNSRRAPVHNLVAAICVEPIRRKKYKHG